MVYKNIILIFFLEKIWGLSDILYNIKWKILGAVLMIRRNSFYIYYLYFKQYLKMTDMSLCFRLTSARLYIPNSRLTLFLNKSYVDHSFENRIVNTYVHLVNTTTLERILSLVPTQRDLWQSTNFWLLGNVEIYDMYVGCRDVNVKNDTCQNVNILFKDSEEIISLNFRLRVERRE